MATKTKKTGMKVNKPRTPEVVSLPNPFAKSMAGRNFVGQTEVLTLGEGKYSWGA